MAWGDIPAELRALARWVCWRYEAREGAKKPTKIPIHPRTLQNIDITNIDHCSSFDECVFAVQNNRANGVGFCLFKKDGYCIIDLDQTLDPKELDRQIKIHQAFASYSERSPSGTGLHIVIRASIPCGRHRGVFEIYDSLRFITFTGDVYNNAPIAHQNELANILQDEMSRDRQGNEINFDGGPQKDEDDVVINKASSDEVFCQLLRGDWQSCGRYPSQSEGDQAFMNFIAHHTDNKAQMRRIFDRSGLGWRPKARRDNYVMPMIDKAFDLRLPPIDFSKLSGEWRARNNEIASATLRDQVWDEEKDIPDVLDVSRPPGIIGDMADYFYWQAQRPVREIALVSAIAAFAGIAGRQFNTPTDAGLNLYCVLLAKTSTGKEAMNHGISRLFAAAKHNVPAIENFLGASGIASGPALQRQIEKHPCCLSILGEFAHLLTNMSANNAAPHYVSMRGTFLNMYTKSGRGNVFHPSVYSEKEKNIAAVAEPAFSFLGECTPGLFFECLSEDSIASGLLTRFFIIQYHGDRVAANKTRYPDPPRELVSQFCDFAALTLGHQRANKVVNAQFNERTQFLSETFDAMCDEEIRNNESGVTRDLFGRGHLTALKIASLYAISRNPYHPEIQESDWMAAQALVTNSINNIVRKFRRGEVGKLKETSEKALQLVRDQVKIYIEKHVQTGKIPTVYKVTEEMLRNGVMPYTFFQSKLASRPEFNPQYGLKGSTLLKTLLKDLCDQGLLAEVPAGMRQVYGSHRLMYSIRELPE